MYQWTEAYSVGNDTIDEQHQQLFAILNKLTTIDDNNEDEISKTLDELLEYVNKHFSDEEELMKKGNYPDLDDHTLKHKTFTGKVSDAIVDYTLGSFNKKDLEEYLANWLIEHIEGEDMKYKGYI